MREDERAHQIEMLRLILGVTIGALERLGDLTPKQARRVIRIIKHEETEPSDE